MLNTLEKKILESWKERKIQNPEIDPQDHLLDSIGAATKELNDSLEYLRFMNVNDCGDAIDFGCADIRGFAYFNLVRTFVTKRNTLGKMSATS